MENQKQITDQELKEELLRSYIDDNKKNELAPLIVDMTDDDRQQLMTLIQRSQQEFEKAQSEGIDEDALSQLNQKYQKEIDNLTRQSVDAAFHESEVIEEKEEVSAMQEIEGEIGSMVNQPSDTKGADEVAMNSRQDLVKKSHKFRNFILMIIVLILIVAGIIYGLQFL